MLSQMQKKKIMEYEFWFKQKLRLYLITFLWYWEGGTGNILLKGKDRAYQTLIRLNQR